MTMATGDKAEAPFCSNCGYVLAGLADSSRCPECGRPFVEVLTRPHTQFAGGKRYRSESTIFGMPVLAVAIGPHGNERRGHARGFIAVGDIATGVVALGGIARGIVALGGIALGCFSVGGVSLGLLTAIGGCSLGGIAAGGVAVGVVASGGVAVGLVANGATALGYFARGGAAIGTHIIRFGLPPDPQAARLFERIRFLVGSWPPSIVTVLQAAVVPLASTIVATVFASLLALFASRHDT